jgi:hypothetical protein
LNAYTRMCVEAFKRQASVSHGCETSGVVRSAGVPTLLEIIETFRQRQQRRRRTVARRLFRAIFVQV